MAVACDRLHRLDRIEDQLDGHPVPQGQLGINGLMLRICGFVCSAIPQKVRSLRHKPRKKKKYKNYFASSNRHPPRSRAYGRYNKILRILEISTPNSHEAKPDWRAALAGDWRGPLTNTGAPSRYWPYTRHGKGSGYSAGSTGEQVWRDTGRDPLSISSGRILGGIHWQAALAGYSA